MLQSLSALKPCRYRKKRSLDARYTGQGAERVSDRLLRGARCYERERKELLLRRESARCEAPLRRLERLERLEVSEEKVQALEAKTIQGQAAILEWKEAKPSSCLSALTLGEAADHASWEVEDDLLGCGRDW